MSAAPYDRMHFTASSRRADDPQKKGGRPEAARRQEVIMSSVTTLESARQLRTPEEWLVEQIHLSKSKVRTAILELTPDLARALLARNPNNRAVSRPIVEKYARDIANGVWAFNGEPIIVSRDGSLNDGQHRCEAVVEANTAIRVVLVFGTDRDSRLTIDQGKARTGGDYLGMEGYHDGLALAAAAGFFWQYRQFGRLWGQSGYRATKSEVLSTVRDHPDLVKSLAAIPAKGSDSVGGRSVLAFAHFVFTERSSVTVADEFFAGLVSGIGLSARSPILYARNRMIDNRGRLRPNEKAELIFRAWGAWRRRETPKTMVINDGVLPVVER